MADVECKDSPTGKHDWDFMYVIVRDDDQAELFICSWCGKDKLVPI